MLYHLIVFSHVICNKCNFHFNWHQKCHVTHTLTPQMSCHKNRNIFKILTRLEIIMFTKNYNCILQSFVKETSICSKYSLVAPSQFVEVIWERLKKCSSNFETIIKPTHTDAADGKSNFIASIIDTTVFSCAYITQQGFCNDKLTVSNQCDIGKQEFWLLKMVPCTPTYLFH